MPKNLLPRRSSRSGPFPLHVSPSAESVLVAWQSKLHSITPMVTIVHVILWSLVVLTWMRDTIESM